MLLGGIARPVSPFGYASVALGESLPTRIGARCSDRNDVPDFASFLGVLEPDAPVRDLGFDQGDRTDWYVFETPQAMLRLGQADAAAILANMLEVRFDDAFSREVLRSGSIAA